MAQAQADAQAARNAAIVALAAHELSGLWPRVDWESPDAAKAVATVYGAIVTRYGQATAAVAVTVYDELRAEKGLTSSFAAVPADPFPQAAINKAVRSAFLGVPQPTEHDETPNTTSELPLDQRVQTRVDGGLQRHILQPARDTIAENVAADPAKPRYIRVPKGATTCAFCVLLASREIKSVKGAKNNFTGYASKKSATTVVGRGDVARGNQPLGEKYHNHCDCEAVPIFPDDNITDLSPNFHDFQDMYYKAAADAGTHRDAKKILASMRKLHGLK